jgi:Dyp-type peroxidase family
MGEQPMATIDFADIQGLVRFGHGQLLEAELLLLRIKDLADAKTWLAGAPVTTAEWQDPPPTTALQIAVSAEGLRALGLEADILAQFEQPFLAGMAGEESRSRRLGDTGPNDPADWLWGQPVPHVLLMVYASPGGLEAFRSEVLDDAFEVAFEVIQTLPTGTARGMEPFGFADGISQPVIDWDQTFPTELHSRLDYANMLAPGELVLGLGNEYGEVTPRPLVDAAIPGAEALPRAAEDRGRSDLGLNGTYLVLRHLQQDVRGFWQFLDQAASGDPERREAFATAMVGRQRDGQALIPDERDIPGGKARNNFTFDGDVDGHSCPLGAHIRRANPRTGDHPPGVSGFWSWILSTLGFRRRRDGLPGRHDLVASTRFHRLIRRGREFGPALAPEDALRPGPEEERGIYFICLCANIVRQFEFVQNAWVASATFDGLAGEADALLGNREPTGEGAATDGFSIQRTAGVPDRLTGLPLFVSVRGGGYFFMPGIRALRFIASRQA